MKASTKKIVIGVGNLPIVTKLIRKAGFSMTDTPFDMIEGGSLVKRVGALVNEFNNFSVEGMRIIGLHELAARMTIKLDCAEEIVLVWWSKAGWTPDTECLEAWRIAQSRFVSGVVRLVLFENDITLEGADECVFRISETVTRVRAAICPGDYAIEDVALNKQLFKRYI